MPSEPAATGAWPRAVHATLLALVSAAALVVEIIAARLLAPYLGMSLYTWTTIIAVVLAGLSLGHWLGGQLDPGQRQASARRLSVILALAGFTTGAIPLLLRLVSEPVLALELGALWRIGLLVSLLFLVPSALAGMVSPILTRMALDAEPRDRSRVLGSMFAAGALGSIAGTLSAGFLFVAWLGSRDTLLLVAALELLLAAAFLAHSRPRLRTAVTHALAWCALALALGALSMRLQANASPCTVESSYFCIRVLDAQTETGRPGRLMVLDHMVHGITDRDEPRWLHGSYLALMDRLTRLHGIAERPFSAFFVGGGAFTLPRAWIASFPRARMIVAELDPAVTRVARRDFWMPQTRRLRVHHADARSMLARELSASRFQVIVGDAFHDISIPAHLATLEFARLVRSRLAPGGHYLLHALDRAHRPRLVLSLVKTLEQVFEQVEVWVDDAQWSAGGRVSFVLRAGEVASPVDGIRGASPDDLDAGRRWHRLDTALVRGALRRHRALLLTDDLAPVDRLMFQVLEQDL